MANTIEHIASYLGRVAKPIPFMTMNVLKNQMPVTGKMVDENAEIAKSLYKNIVTSKAIQNKIKGDFDRAIKKPVGKLIDNLKRDLKSGNFYHPESADDFDMGDLGDMMASMGIDLGGDEAALLSGLANSDEFSDQGGGGEDNGVTTGDQMVAATVAKTNIASTNSLAQAMARNQSTALSAAQSIASSQSQQMDHNATLVTSGFSSVIQGINSLIDFNNEAFVTHIKNSTSFYQAMTQKAEERNAILKEMLDMQREMYKNSLPKQQGGSGEDEMDMGMGGGKPPSMDDIFNGNFNLQTYYNYVLNNMKNSTLYQSYSMMLASVPMMIAEYARNPMQKVMEAGIEAVMGPRLRVALNNLDDTIVGGIQTGLAKLFDYGRKPGSGIMGTLASMLGYKAGTVDLRSIDMSKYERGAMSWNGIAQKALVEVIPSLLGRIEAATSGQTERMFNYQTGRWTKVTDVMHEESRYKNRELTDVSKNIKDQLDAMIYAMQTDNKQKASLRASMKDVIRGIYENGYVDYADIKQNVGNRYGKNQKNVELISNLLRGVDEHDIIGMTAKIAKSKENFIKYAQGQDPNNPNVLNQYLNGALYGAIVTSDQNVRKQTFKGSGRVGLPTTESVVGKVPNMARDLFEYKDKKGKSLLDYQFKIFSEVYTIRNLISRGGFGMGSGGGTPTPSNPYDNTVNPWDNESIKQLQSRLNAQKPEWATDEGHKTYLASVQKTLAQKQNIQNIQAGLHTALSKEQKAQQPSKDNRTPEQKERSEESRAYKQQRLEAHLDTLKERYHIGDFEKQVDLHKYQTDQKYKAEIDEKLAGMIRDSKEGRKGREIEEARNFMEKTIDFVKEMFSDPEEEIEKTAEEAEKKAGGLWKLIKAPRDVLASLVETADKAVYNFLFDSDEVVKMKDGTEVRGLFNKMVYDMESTFDKLNNWLDETFGEFKKWFKDSKIGDTIKNSIKDWFNIDIDELWGKGKEKVKDIFGIGGKALKESFKDATSTVFSSVTGTLKDLGVDTSTAEKQFNKLMNPEEKEEKTGGKADAVEYNGKVYSYEDARSLIDTLKEQGKTAEAADLQKTIDQKVADKMAAQDAGKNKKYEYNGKKYDKSDLKQIIAQLKAQGKLQEANELEDQLKNGGVQAHALGATQVTKGGLAVISPGEAIIPADLNPWNPDRDKVNRQVQSAQEEVIRQRFMSKLDNEVGPYIEKRASGDTSFGTKGKDAAKGKTEDAQKRVDQLFLMNDLATKDRMYDWLEKANYDIVDPHEIELLKKSKVFKSLTKSEQERILYKLNKSGYDVKYDTEEIHSQEFAKTDAEGKANIFNEASEFANIAFGVNGKKALDMTTDFIKNNYKDTAKGGATGALLSAVLPLGGPLMGAVFGAAANLIKNNKTLNEYVFGKEIADEQGNKHRTGGLISEKMVKTIQKYMPDLKKYGITGSLLGLVTPFGPMGGLMLGAGAAFVKNNADAREFFFGDSGGLLNEDRKKRIKKALPGIGAATLAGLFLGPWGIVGNAMVGAGIGMLSTTEIFKKIFLGTKGRDGKRYGGLAGAIRVQITDPFKKSMMQMSKDISKWFREDIMQPIGRGILPMAKLGFFTMRNLMSDMFKKITFRLAGTFFDKWFNKILAIPRKAGSIGKWLVRNTIGRAGSWAAKGIEGLGNRAEAHMLKNGMLAEGSSQERVDKANILGVNNNWVTSDKAIMKMNNNTLEDASQVAAILTKMQKRGKGSLEGDILQQKSTRVNYLKGDLQDYYRKTGNRDLSEVAISYTDIINKITDSSQIPDVLKLVHQDDRIPEAYKKEMTQLILDAAKDVVNFEKAKKMVIDKNFAQKQKDDLKRALNLEDVDDETFNKMLKSGNLKERLESEVKIKRRQAEAEKAKKEADKAAEDAKSPAEKNSEEQTQVAKDSLKEQTQQTSFLSQTVEELKSINGFFTNQEHINLNNIKSKSVRDIAKQVNDGRDLTDATMAAVLRKDQKRTQQVEKEMASTRESLGAGKNGVIGNLSTKELMKLTMDKGDGNKKILGNFANINKFASKHKAKILNADKLIALGATTVDRITKLTLMGYTISAKHYKDIQDLSPLAFETVMQLAKVGVMFNSFKEFKDITKGKESEALAHNIVQFAKVQIGDGEAVKDVLASSEIVNKVNTNHRGEKGFALDAKYDPSVHKKYLNKHGKNKWDPNTSGFQEGFDNLSQEQKNEILKSSYTREQLNGFDSQSADRDKHFNMDRAVLTENAKRGAENVSVVAEKLLKTTGSAVASVAKDFGLISNAILKGASGTISGSVNTLTSAGVSLAGLVPGVNPDADRIKNKLHMDNLYEKHIENPIKETYQQAKAQSKYDDLMKEDSEFANYMNNTYYADSDHYDEKKMHDKVSTAKVYLNKKTKPIKRNLSKARTKAGHMRDSAVEDTLNTTFSLKDAVVETGKELKSIVLDIGKWASPKIKSAYGVLKNVMSYLGKKGKKYVLQPLKKLGKLIADVAAYLGKGVWDFIIKFIKANAEIAGFAAKLAFKGLKASAKILKESLIRLGKLSVSIFCTLKESPDRIKRLIQNIQDTVYSIRADIVKLGFDAQYGGQETLKEIFQPILDFLTFCMKAQEETASKWYGIKIDDNDGTASTAEDLAQKAKDKRDNDLKQAKETVEKHANGIPVFGMGNKKENTKSINNPTPKKFRAQTTEGNKRARLKQKVYETYAFGTPLFKSIGSGIADFATHVVDPTKKTSDSKISKGITNWLDTDKKKDDKPKETPKQETKETNTQQTKPEAVTPIAQPQVNPSLAQKTMDNLNTSAAKESLDKDKKEGKKSQSTFVPTAEGDQVEYVQSGVDGKPMKAHTKDNAEIDKKNQYKLSLQERMTTAMEKMANGGKNALRTAGEKAKDAGGSLFDMLGGLAKTFLNLPFDLLNMFGLPIGTLLKGKLLGLGSSILGFGGKVVNKLGSMAKNKFQKSKLGQKVGTKIDKILDKDGFGAAILRRTKLDKLGLKNRDKDYNPEDNDTETNVSKITSIAMEMRDLLKQLTEEQTKDLDKLTGAGRDKTTKTKDGKEVKTSEKGSKESPSIEGSKGGKDGSKGTTTKKKPGFFSRHKKGIAGLAAAAGLGALAYNSEDGSFTDNAATMGLGVLAGATALNSISSNDSSNTLDNVNDAISDASDVAEITKGAKELKGRNSDDGLIDKNTKAMNKTESDAATKVDSEKRQIQGAADDITNGSGQNKELVQSVIEKFKSAMRTIQHACQRWLPKGAGKALSSFSSAVIKKLTEPSALKRIVTKLGRQAAAAGAGAASMGIGALVITAAGAVSDFLHGYNSADQMLEVPPGSSSEGMKIVAGLVTAICGSIPFLGIIIPEDEVLKLVVKYVGAVFGFGQQEIEKLKSAGDKAQQSVSNIVQSAKNMGNAWLDKIGKVTTGVVDSVIGGAQNVASNIANKAADVAKAVKSASSNAFGTVSNTVGAIKNWVVNNANRGVDWLKEKASNAYNTVKDIGSSAANAVSSGASWVGNKISSGASWAWNGIKSVGNWVMGKGKHNTPQYGGGQFYSQLDPQYAMDYNAGYDHQHQTMADSGCGPAALSNALSNVGIDVDPRVSAQYALQNGYKEQDGGTKPGFFKDFMGKMGVQAQEFHNQNDIKESLKNGNPVILMGKDGRGETKSNPYAENPHYVTATGIDNKGNITIQDPETFTPNKKYRASDVLNKTTIAVGTGKHSVFGTGSHFLSNIWKPRFGMGDGAATPEKMWALANWASEKCGVDAKFIFGQWYHESGAFKSRLAVDNYNFGGMTQSEPTGDPSDKQPDGGNYYMHFGSPEEWAEYYAWYINRCDGVAGTDSVQAFAQALKNNGYFGASIDEYVAGVEGGMKAIPSGPPDMSLIDQSQFGKRDPGSPSKAAPHSYTDGSSSGGDNKKKDKSTEDVVRSVATLTGAALDRMRGIGSGMGKHRFGMAKTTHKHHKPKQPTFKQPKVVNPRPNTPIFSQTSGSGKNTFIPSFSSYGKGLAHKAAKIYNTFKYGRGTDVPEMVWNFLMSKKIGTQATAAIMGNMEAESTYNPSAVNSSGAIGLCQWYKERATALKNYAASKGTNWDDPQTQLEYLWSEIEKSYQSVINDLIHAANLDDAVVIWEKEFERSGDTASLPRRKASAKEAFDKQGKGIAVGATYNGSSAPKKKKKGGLFGALDSIGSAISSALNPFTKKSNSSSSSSGQQTQTNNNQNQQQSGNDQQQQNTQTQQSNTQQQSGSGKHKFRFGRGDDTTTTDTSNQQQSNTQQTNNQNQQNNNSSSSSSSDPNQGFFDQLTDQVSKMTSPIGEAMGQFGSSLLDKASSVYGSSLKGFFGDENPFDQLFGGDDDEGDDSGGSNTQSSNITVEGNPVDTLLKNIQGLTITSDYMDTNNRPTAGAHGGVDLATDVSHAPIPSPISGTVHALGEGDGGGYGNYVQIQDSKGNYHMFAHCSKQNVSVGQQVKPGDIIGNIGETGAAYGEHIHYEIDPPNNEGAVKSGPHINPHSYAGSGKHSIFGRGKDNIGLFDPIGKKEQEDYDKGNFDITLSKEERDKIGKSDNNNFGISAKEIKKSAFGSGKYGQGFLSDVVNYVKRVSNTVHDWNDKYKNYKSEYDKLKEQGKEQKQEDQNQQQTPAQKTEDAAKQALADATAQTAADNTTTQQQPQVQKLDLQPIIVKQEETNKILMNQITLMQQQIQLLTQLVTNMSGSNNDQKQFRNTNTGEIETQESMRMKARLSNYGRGSSNGSGDLFAQGRNNYSTIINSMNYIASR